ncbi:MAG: zinc ribbon domain-containing protein [Oscillospiraceae bacterium]|nr:zinc ribbon domain-containing protein [Oscillospiraceae bacterium]
MSFFDDLTKKAKIVANVATEKAREAADSAKISADIIKERRELDKNYRAIGQWFVYEHEDCVPEAVADLVHAVQASRKRIEELQAMREHAEETAAEEETGTVCPICGKVSDSKFCPGCGAPLSN